MKNIFKYLFVLILIIELIYSFWQYTQEPLDGDISSIVMITRGYNAVMHDPLGIGILMSGDRYPNPNRFFAHATCVAYFRTIPFLFQKFVSPVESIYLAAALAKTLIQGFILWILARYITLTFSPKKDWLIAFILLFPFFQTTGYQQTMSIIDPSITYNFFYALPNGLMFLFFLPFYQQFINNQRLNFSLLQHFLLSILLVFLVFSGPLPAAIGIVAFFVILIAQITQKGVTSISKTLWAYAVGVILLSFYSIYIGTHNLEASIYKLSLIERYLNIPSGLFGLLFTKLGYPLFLLSIIINIILLKYTPSSETFKRLMVIFKWFGLFSLLYILLLPIGGYRAYRPNIIRGDVMMPIYLGLLIMWGTTAYYLIQNLAKKIKIYYAIWVFIVLSVFTIADEPLKMDKTNRCEKDALYQISASTEKEVWIENDCPILAWVRPFNATDAHFNAEFFYFLGITREFKEYRQK